ncbi:hypothetical protein [Gandjariella thermophila]|uniref:STAS domain-containing protein n=1 Tax=Gandjariella thermophila TaxID=1931992 RepID=A0A4D4J9X9_9PSEU|nr:hypothetical protein [Gandjariella thermophila]GDY33625.1 hypothetical protein GTS_52580 [Gandjariella thermophila]
MGAAEQLAELLLLHVWREIRGGAVVVHAAGEVDVSSAPTLARQLAAAEAEARRSICAVWSPSAVPA